MRQRPPAILRRVVGACLPSEDERSVLQDLDVLYDRRVESDGRRARDIAYPAAIAAARRRSFASAEPWLRILVQRGFSREQIGNDPHLAGLSGDPRFQAFIRNG